MSVAVTVLSGLLLAMAIAQLPYVLAFVRAVRRPAPIPPDDAACPPALVVLPLRGTDPTLSRCLAGLVRQDYPSYDVRVVVDHRDDPAWEVVRSVLEEYPAPNVRVEELRERRSTCSLKCSSLLQATTELDPSYRFVAHIDADVVPHRSWLRELAVGFRDPSVGAVTGNRWYVPTPPTWGALVRWLWNLAAVPQMYVYGVAWGGSMAVRSDLLEAADLRARWAGAFSEDTALTSVLRAAGLRVRFEPSLMMVTPAVGTVAEAEAWIRRQLVCARLHHPAWPAVVGHGLLTSSLLLLLILVGFAALVAGDASARLALAALLAYQAVMVGCALGLEWSVGRRLGRRGVLSAALPEGVGLRAILAIPLTQAVHLRALLGAWFARSVCWRGVRYDLTRGGSVRRVEDPPVQAVAGG